MTIDLVPFTFNSIKLFTVTINGKHWTRAVPYLEDPKKDNGIVVIQKK